MAKAVTSLEQVDIMETNITQQNKRELLTVVSTEDSRLKNLRINSTKFSSAEDGLLARSVNCLEQVTQDSGLTQQQTREIIIVFSAGESHARYQPVLSVLARAVNMLEEVHLCDTQLSKQQAEGIMTERLVKTSLRRLDMSCWQMYMSSWQLRSRGWMKIWWPNKTGQQKFDRFDGEYN